MSEDRLMTLTWANLCVGRMAIGHHGYPEATIPPTVRKGVIEKVTVGHMFIYVWIDETPFPFPDEVLLEEVDNAHV